MSLINVSIGHFLMLILEKLQFPTPSPNRPASAVEIQRCRRNCRQVTTDGDVEENKELALELERAIHSARDITLGVFEPIPGNMSVSTDFQFWLIQGFQKRGKPAY